MKAKSSNGALLKIKTLLVSIFFIVVAAASVCAQGATDGEAAQRRLARARALAAAHNLAAAASELDALRIATTDDATRDLARLLLMGIYLEEADYPRAKALLEETFKARSAENESSIRSYFALAGQTVNSARAHLERYKSFGINISSADLPSEAVNDLDRLRLLLEDVATQAAQIGSENSKSTDAAALLEDVTSVRAGLARDEPDRLRWQREFAAARQRLAASETHTSGNAANSTRRASVANVTTMTASQSSANNTTNTATNDAANSSSATENSNTQSTTTAAATPAATTRSTTTSQRSQTDSSRNTQSDSASASNVATNAHPLEVGSLIDRATQKISPSYPPTARTARISGIVTVYLEVDERGAVATVQRASGPQLLRQAATDAARRWKFRPMLVDGQPVRVVGYINFNFSL